MPSLLGILFFFFFSFLLLFLPKTTMAQNCSVTYCSHSLFPIRFPFRADGVQPESCGFPGFNLSCNGNGRTILRIPGSGDFLVRSIDYMMQQIRIYDPGNCLPRRLLALNLSDSPFSAASYESYTFLNCPHTVSYKSSAIQCLSNDTNTVIATTNQSFASSMSKICSTMANLPVPVSWPVYYHWGTAKDLEEDLELSWYSPNCRDCEINGGFCGFKSDTAREIGCFYDPESSKRGLMIFRIICMSIALPAVVCALGIGCFLCCTNRRQGRTGSGSSLQGNSMTPQPAAVPVGLDESTIQSFTKVVLGESMRVTGPNNNVCPICLSEYLPKEILRCIPECHHCFHADCIDGWLRMNSSCPLCRNSPSPARPAQQQLDS